MPVIWLTPMETVTRIKRCSWIWKEREPVPNLFLVQKCPQLSSKNFLTREMHFRRRPRGVAKRTQLSGTCSVDVCMFAVCVYRCLWRLMCVVLEECEAFGLLTIWVQWHLKKGNPCIGFLTGVIWHQRGKVLEDVGDVFLSVGVVG